MILYYAGKGIRFDFLCTDILSTGFTLDVKPALPRDLTFGSAVQSLFANSRLVLSQTLVPILVFGTTHERQFRNVTSDF